MFETWPGIEGEVQVYVGLRAPSIQCHLRKGSNIPSPTTSLAMPFASRSLRYLPRSGARLLQHRTPGPFSLALPPSTPQVPLAHALSTSASLGAKKSKKSGNKSSSQDVDDDATMVIRTKGKASRKGATLASAEHSSTGSSRRGAAGEEPIESDVEAGAAHDDVVIEKAKVKMEKTVSWFKSVVFDGVERGKGRITPGMLDLPTYSRFVFTSSVRCVALQPC
jgi:hypothetical protein